MELEDVAFAVGFFTAALLLGALAGPPRRNGAAPLADARPETARLRRGSPPSSRPLGALALLGVVLFLLAGTRPRRREADQ